MGFVKDMIKAGTTGLVAGAVASHSMNKAYQRQAQQQTYAESMRGAVKSWGRYAILKVPINMKKEAWCWILNQNKLPEDWVVISNKEYEVIAKKGKIESSTALETVNGKLAYGVQGTCKDSFWSETYFSQDKIKRLNENFDEEVNNINELFSGKDVLEEAKDDNSKFCSECGKTIKKSVKFCEHCGTKQINN